MQNKFVPLFFSQPSAEHVLPPRLLFALLLEVAGGSAASGTALVLSFSLFRAGGALAGSRLVGMAGGGPEGGSTGAVGGGDSFRLSELALGARSLPLRLESFGGMIVSWALARVS